MSGTHLASMGDRGRLVIPADLRARVGLHEGQPIIFVETPGGLLMLTQTQLRDLVRSDLQGRDLVGQLLAERRATASAEDSA